MGFIRLLFNIPLLVVNTLVFPALLFLMALLKLIPIRPIQALGKHWAVQFAQMWAHNNRRIFNLTLPTKWTLDLPKLSKDTSYLVISNHQSWVDILALQYAFNGKIPFFRFFLKYELIYVPILGMCWWVLDYPFMRRHTKEQIKKNPELKNQDKEIAIRQMQKFKDTPVSIMVFVEGTRFTKDKHAQQQSPYQNLLKPRAAGAAYALNILAEQLQTLLDVTIVYPNGTPSFLDLLKGRCPEICIHAQTLHIDESLRVGDYETQKPYRVAFQTWLNGIWADKDMQIMTLNNPDSMRTKEN